MLEIKMKQRILDQRTQSKVSSLGLGCMGMADWYGPTDDAQSIETIHHAFNLGINFFDTADVYGHGRGEQLLGRAIKAFRNDIILASKCGITFDAKAPNTLGVNCQPDYIKKACEASLERLNVDHIDLYYLHRMDSNTPIEESMQALADLIQAGKIRYVGLSEANAETIRKAHAIVPITAIQTEYSLGVRKAAEAVLPVCNELNISFVPYSPIGRGLLSGKYQQTSDFAPDDVRQNFPQFQANNIKANMQFVSALQNIANKKNCTAAQLVLAWLLAQNEHIMPIPGTRQIQHLQENIGAVGVNLTQEDLTEIELACQLMPMIGQRLPKELLDLFELEG